MERGQAFLVVGHKRWGKSKTLKALTGGRLFQYWRVGDYELFIRRMSNDDVPEDFREFVRSLRPTNRQYVILAFCPVFEEGDADATLRDLRRNYDIFSFVLRHAFDRRRRITQDEVEGLQRYGEVEVLEDHAEASDRAAAFRDFIERNIA